MTEITYSLDQTTGIATFLLDNISPLNTITERFITELNAAIIQSRRDKVNGVIFISTKPKSFLEGFNLLDIISITSPLKIKHLLLTMQETFAALATSPFPVAALLRNQKALGTGFELLLWACDQIFASPGSRMGLPEIKSGLFPANGALETLKRVVGFEQSVNIIMTGKILPAEFFVQYELVTIVETDNGLDLAKQWLINHVGKINRNYDPTWIEPDSLDIQRYRALLKEARTHYVVCPQKPYFQAALDAFIISLEFSLEEASRQHAEIFTSLVMDFNVKNKIDLLLNVANFGSKLVRVDKKNALPIRQLAVIGVGLMGQGIAQVCADAGIKVFLIDTDKTIAQTAREKIHMELMTLVKRGHWTHQRMDAVMNNICVAIDYQELSKIPLVIEAVFEDLNLKRQILAEVQQVNPNIIFASNTSTLPLAEIAKDALRPEQVVGMHYFFPAPLMSLLEVIKGVKTSPKALATAIVCGRLQGKICILVGDGPGFYTSRTFGVYIMTGFLLAEMGLDPWRIDRLALEVGFPQGPFQLYGIVGGNVIYHAAKAMHLRNTSLPFPKTMVNMYEAGYVGGNSPSFYKGENLEPNKLVQKFIVYDSNRPIPKDEEAKEMLILGMVNQAFLCLDEGILQDYISMDIGAALGIGFPDCWHGPARYVSQKGVKATSERLRIINEKFGLAYYKPALEFARLFACGLDRSLI